MIRVPVEQGHATNNTTQVTNHQPPGDFLSARVLLELLGDEAQRVITRLMWRGVVELDDWIATHGKDIVDELGFEFAKLESGGAQCWKWPEVEDRHWPVVRLTFWLSRGRACGNRGRERSMPVRPVGCSGC